MTSPQKPDESETLPALWQQPPPPKQGPVADYVFIPGYRTVRLLSEDSRSWIFQAVDRDAEDVLVAIVVSRRNDPDCQAWYRRVGDVLARLDHPSIPPCRHNVTLDGFPYLVLFWVIAEDVISRVRRLGPMVPDEALSVLGAIADGLDHAHEREVVHGDLHPRRVGFTAEGRVGIMGFGEFPAPEGLIGNLRHLAPEQFEEGKPPRPQSDVYALAEIAFFLLSGRFAFERGSPEEGPDQTPGHATLLGQVRPDLPPATGLVIERALAPRPQDRFPKASQFVRTLGLALGVGEIHRSPEEQPTWREEIDCLMAVLIDPSTSEAIVQETVARLSQFSPLESDHLAPLLVALPRLVDLFFGVNALQAREVCKFVGTLGEPCLGTFQELLRNRADIKDLRIDIELLEATVLCGGVQDVAELLLHHTESWLRRMAAVALSSSAGPAEAVGRALRAGWADPDSSVRAATARGYMQWLDRWIVDLWDQRGQLLAPFLEAAARDEALRCGFDAIFNNHQQMAESLALMMSFRIDDACCTDAGRATAAYALRYFPRHFPNFRERLERCARQDKYREEDEQVRTAATESLRVLSGATGF